jgi:hypothetical protein
MEGLDQAINMLATMSANQDRIEAAIVAYRLKPEEGEEAPAVQILTIGNDAVTVFGMGELVKMQLYGQLPK